jgi:hypothetical protein
MPFSSFVVISTFAFAAIKLASAGTIYPTQAYGYPGHGSVTCPGGQTTKNAACCGIEPFDHYPLHVSPLLASTFPRR